MDPIISKLQETTSCASSWTSVLSGVPQGTVLGLFVLSSSTTCLSVIHHTPDYMLMTHYYTDILEAAVIPGHFSVN